MMMHELISSDRCQEILCLRDSLGLDYFGSTKKLAAKPETLTEALEGAMDAQLTILKGEKQ